MSNGTSDGERRDDSFVDRLGDRISAAPTPPHAGPPAPGRVLGTGDFAEADSTTLSRESEPPPPLAGTLPDPAEESGLYDAPLGQPPPSRPVDAFAEFEATEMPGESTRIEESEVIADQSTAILDEGPKMPFLFVESGKDQGKEYVLQEGETGVGRGIDNDVILTDVSVSRKHLRVLRDGASLVLRDLGSGNGTTVNGKRVHQIALTEGDRIELGETVLVVRLPADAGASAPPSTSTQETALPSDPAAPLPPAMIPAFAGALPPPAYGTSESLAPRDGNTATVRLPRRTLALAVAGVAALALLVGVGVGAMILVAGQPETIAQPLPTGTLPTTRPVSAPPTSVAVAAPVTGVPVTGVPATGVPATGVPATGVPATGVPATGVPATGVPVASAVPATGVPVATTVPPPAEPLAPPSSVAVAPPPTTQASAPPPSSTVASAPPTTRAPRGTRPPRETATPTATSAQARIANAYNTGDFDGAAAIARDAARHTTGAEQRSLETLANNIDSFAGLYPRIHAAGDALGPVAGTVPIALRLDRQIVSGGHYAREIQPRYVRYLVAQARSQMSSAPQTACPRVREVLDLDAANTEAQGLARQCETTASRLLADAQSHERSDAAGAQRTYTQVQQMVPRTSATYRTAQERLAAMRRTTHPVDEDE